MPSTARPSWNRNAAPRATPLKLARFWLICLFILAWSVLIIGRLFWLQVVRHGEYVERADKQQQRTFEVAPRRGILYDRNRRELAITVLVDSIFAVPAEIEDKQAAALALAAIVHTDPDDAQTTEEQIAARLKAGRNFAWVARRVTADAGARVKAQIAPARSREFIFKKSSSAFIQTTKSPRRCLVMWAWTTTDWADWSRSSSRSCTVFPDGCTPRSMRAATCSAPRRANLSPDKI